MKKEEEKSRDLARWWRRGWAAEARARWRAAAAWVAEAPRQGVAQEIWGDTYADFFLPAACGSVSQSWAVDRPGFEVFRG